MLLLIYLFIYYVQQFNKTVATTHGACIIYFSERFPEMRFLFFPLFAVASFNIAKGDTSCFPDQKLTSEGNCIDCDYCPSGEGVDLKEKV